MLPPKPTLPAEQRRLLKLFKRLDDTGKQTILSFSEFLAEQQSDQSEVKSTERDLQPVDIPRPEDESVVAAIKRLKASYHMLDRKDLFSETSTLMTAHVMRGRSSSDVIDELEVLFESQYRQYILPNEPSSNDD
ncbi:MAG: Crp/Fnr family transcriptional regulator [Gammaproteobacteria bacterium]|nr:Crp/Fnr family transcriptional regulator [Gammaproteobacteria bacterium]